MDEVRALPDIAVPQGVDLGHLTEAADHGQVNPNETALKSQIKTATTWESQNRALGEADGVVEPLLAVGDGLGEDGGLAGDGWRWAVRSDRPHSGSPEPPEAAETGLSNGMAV